MCGSVCAATVSPSPPNERFSGIVGFGAPSATRNSSQCSASLSKPSGDSRYSPGSSAPTSSSGTTSVTRSQNQPEWARSGAPSA